MTALLYDAIGALDFLLEQCLRLPVQKALDPNDPQDFVTIVQRLGKSTFGLAGPAEAKALKKAIGELDVDWSKLSAAQKDKVVAAAKANITGAHSSLWPKVQEHLEVNAQKIGLQTKKSAVEQFNLGISVDLDKVDQKVLQHLAQSQGLFVRDEYGKRSDLFGTKAKQIVEQGLKDGMGRSEIAAELDKTLTAQQFNRSRAYWEVIAGTFANRSRTYSNLASFQNALISVFTFVAMLDERTSNVCRFMHGKSFSVRQALQAYAATEELEEPGDIKSTQPWLSVGKNDDGSEFIYYKDAKGSQHHVADVEESAMGKVDETGKFKNALPDAALAKAGIMSPPLHGHCRSTIEADVESVSVQVPGAFDPQPPPPPREPPPAPTAPSAAGAFFSPDEEPASLTVQPAQGPAVQVLVAPKDAKALAMEKLQALKDSVPTGIAVPSPIAVLTPDAKKAFLSKLDAIEQIITEAKFKPQLKGPQYLKVLDAAVDPLKVEYLVKDKKLLDKAVIKVVQMPGKNFVVVDGHEAAAAQQLLGKQKFKIHVVSLKEWEEEQKKLAAAAATAPKAPPLPPPPAVKPPDVAKPAAPLPGKPVDPAAIMHEKTGEAAGSNQGGFYTGADGVKRYVKFYNDPAQAHGEVLANSVYQGLGLGAPKAVVFDHGGQIAYASEIIDGVTLDQLSRQPHAFKAASKKFFDGFAADVLLGNWDAAGASGDNALFSNGAVMRIDNGGSLLMRAKAGRKNVSDLDVIPEIDVFFSGKNPGYSKLAKAAGYTSVDDFKDDFKKQVSDISKLRSKFGGWEQYVHQYAPGLGDTDRRQMIRMLEARTKLLEEYAKRMDQPAREYTYRADPIKGVKPRAGLKVSDLPHAEPPRGATKPDGSDSAHAHPSTLYSGEAHKAYFDRTKKKVLKVPAESKSAIRSFTDGTYGSVRDSEVAGKPNKQARDIAEAFKHALPEPGTVYRGVSSVSSAAIEKMIQNDGAFRLGQDNKGATSSSAWHPGVSIRRFMHGSEDPYEKDSHKVLFQIHGKSQIPIESISAFDDTETELLIPRDAEFRVLSVARWKGRERVLIIELEEI